MDVKNKEDETFESANNHELIEDDSLKSNNAENNVTNDIVIENKDNYNNGEGIESLSEEIPPRKFKNPSIWWLHSLQRFFLVTGALLVGYLLINSVIIIESYNGTYHSSYVHSFINNIADRNITTFEDSELFNSVFLERVNDIIIYGAVRSQLETDGRFDSQKIIDVTAYANRYGTLPSKYITAHYYLGDLLKWANNGFEYNSEYISGERIAEFLAPENVYATLFISNSDTADEDTILEVKIEYLNELSTHSYFTANEFFNTNSTNEFLSRYIDIADYNKYGMFFKDYYFTDDSELMLVWEDGRAEKLSTVTREYERRKLRADIEANTYRWYDILSNYRRTVEDKNVEDYTADIVSYYDLCKNIESAAMDLSINYRSYERFNNIYGNNNSNVYYAIAKNVNGENEFFTNLDLPPSLTVSGNELGENIDSYFKRPNFKYIKYSPEFLVYETNTSIPDYVISDMVNVYQYVYPENSQIWIGIDTSYYADDVFLRGQQGYNKFFDNYIQYIIIAIVCFILCFVLLIILTILTGRKADENGYVIINLRKFDRIYSEIWAVLALFSLGGLFIFALYLLNDYTVIRLLLSNNNALSLFIIGAYIYIFSLLLSLFYYSFVRRIKAKSLWRDSLLKVILNLLIFISKKIFGFFRRCTLRIKRLIIFFYNNMNLLSRYIIPVLGLALIHLFILIIIAASRDIALIFLLIMSVIIIDIVIGGLIFMSAKARDTIVAGINKISDGDLNHKINERGLNGDNLTLAKAVNRIGKTISNAVEISMRDERMKADLITNVSHDIKTPLTSIINYIDLIKRENIDNPTVKGYISILDQKSQKLKHLTDDLVEASKISSGNIELRMEKINLTELVNQTIGEFSEKFDSRHLHINFRPDNEYRYIKADSRHIWRVIENLFNNIYKYAMQYTRVYIEVKALDKGQVELSFKNISEQPLNFGADELTERFIRGDVSRSTEGSGLGLSIAKSLTEALGGKFEIQMDGDLFKVFLTFPLLEDG